MNLLSFLLLPLGPALGLLDGLLALDVGLFRASLQFFGAARRRVRAAPLEGGALARADAGVRLDDRRGPVLFRVMVLLSGVVFSRRGVTLTQPPTTTTRPP